MMLKALAILLVSWVSPEQQPEHEDELPVWEKHPAEQKYLREQARQNAQTWNKIPRGW